MIDYSVQNKKAWEYNAYAFWVKQSGTPAGRAKRALADPVGINSGFTLKRFDEHPAWTNEKLPGEFTIVADKQ